MKKILFVHHSMELGGAESSLLGLLQSIDYEMYDVSLLLFSLDGELLPLVPEQVHILKIPNSYACLALHIKDVLKRGCFGVAFARLLGKLFGRRYKSRLYMTKQYSHRFALPFLPQIEGKYDMAISFIDPHYIVCKKVDAAVKMGWLHTDFSRMDINLAQDFAMWAGLDYIVQISASCKAVFDEVHPKLADKSIVIENILSERFVRSRADECSVEQDMPCRADQKILTIGRFSPQKNMDNIPAICASIRDTGLDVKWYLIGYGSEELLIRQKIAEAGMQDYVIILGKKENPYPYIKACDLYVQPSRYEGKSVAVREAQMLGKPVVITNYATSASQLTDGYDGVIVPMDNEGCAAGIASLLRDTELQKRLIENMSKSDYTNAKEIRKLYQLLV